jgi:acyl-CoA thioester hydrolase
VRWGDMDALGHVNNAEYFRYMEQARVAWFDAMNIPMLENGRGPVIVKATCEFLKPIVYPAIVSISTHVKKIGRSSITVAHDFCCENDSSGRYAHGEAVIVWVDHAQGKSAPLPERVLRHFR